MRSERPKSTKRTSGSFTVVVTDAGDRYGKRPVEVRLRQFLKCLLRTWGLRVESVLPTTNATSGEQPQA